MARLSYFIDVKYFILKPLR